MSREFRNGGNFDTGGVNPSSAQEGDVWMRTDLHRLWFRNDTGNMEIFGHLTNYNAGSISPTTAKTTIVSTALTTGFYRFFAEIMVTANATALTTTLDFSGTAGAGLNWSQTTFASTTMTQQANFTSLTATTSVTGVGLRRVYGTIGITVAGTITISMTAAGGSFTVPALGAYLDCWRFG